jgi:hypothetical protein
MNDFRRSLEDGIFRKVAEFFRGSFEYRGNPFAPVPGYSPVHGFEGASSARLSAIYGDRLRIRGNGPRVEEHLRDLECLPDSFHNKLVEYFSGHPEGGIDLVDGPVTDVITRLRGVTPEGWPRGRTWKDVPGLHDVETRRVVLGGTGRSGSVLLAAHEAGHAFNEAVGRLSDSAEFRYLYDRIDTKSPYLAQPGLAGRGEAFAEGVASWGKYRHMSFDYQVKAMGNALGMRADRQSMGALLVRYYASLQRDLQSGLL